MKKKSKEKKVGHCMAQTYIALQVTLYFKAEHFKTSIPVAITAMLVMYTLNNSISSKLPQTSSIKFMDIWILYGLFIHFFILVLLVLIEHLPGPTNVVFIEDSKSQMQRIIQHNTCISKKEAVQIFAQKTLLILELIFFISNFISALIIYHFDPE